MAVCPVILQSMQKICETGVRFFALRGHINRGGDAVEFEAVYRRYFSGVYRYLCRLTGSVQLAEEITSETFFRALRSLDSFRGECDMRVWLCQIAKNCYLSWLKKNGRVVRADEAELAEAADETDLEERLAAREQAQLVRSILHGLDEPYREVFMWRVFGELSFREIGELFEKSQNWACVTYHRARNKILNRLEELEHEAGMQSCQ